METKFSKLTIIDGDIIDRGIENLKDTEIVVAIEELGELQKELTKYLRGKCNKEHLTEEFADVIIVLENIARYFNINMNEVQTNMDYKLYRFMQIMKKEGCV